jgi:hypothetical protein
VKSKNGVKEHFYHLVAKPTLCVMGFSNKMPVSVLGLWDAKLVGAKDIDSDWDKEGSAGKPGKK